LAKITTAQMHLPCFKLLKIENFLQLSVVFPSIIFISIQPIQVYNLQQTPPCRTHKSYSTGGPSPSPPFRYATACFENFNAASTSTFTHHTQWCV